MVELKAAGTVVSMLWIKRDSGFTGNEMANLYAKKVVEEGMQINVTTRRDLKNEATNGLKIDWNREWTDTQNKNVRTYALVQHSLLQTPWYQTTEHTRTSIIILCRL